MRFAPLLLAAVTVLCSNCGPSSCRSAGDSQFDRLRLQLEGACCEFHTNPTQSHPDDTCKSNTIGDAATNRLFYGQDICVMWAAQCLAQMGDQASVMTPALIAAVRHGPNNYDTGDGVLPIRDKIVLALGELGDERAVEPLLEALANPRPVDAGPGAIGYASKEPVGEAVALEALGLLGPVAQPAVDRILPHLSRPIENASDERVVRAAASALGKIQDPRAIPPLVEAASDPQRAAFAAQTLGEFGPAADSAAAALIRVIEESPDAPGNHVIRRAIRQIRGKEAMLALPNNYDGMTRDLRRSVSRIAKSHGVKITRMHIDGPKEALAATIASGVTLHIGFDRATWLDRREATGSVRITGGGQDSTIAKYSGTEELMPLVEAFFAAAP